MTATNILETLSHASDDDWSAGLRWYRDAHRFALHLDPSNPYRAAGIIAALSPNTAWADNRARAEQYYRTGTVGHLRNAVERADAIRAGIHPLRALRGPKVRSFYRNIATPDHPGPVTIDRHAYRIANPGTPDKALDRKHEYSRTAAQYRTAARLTGLLPHQVQAITWTAQRGTPE